MKKRSYTFYRITIAIAIFLIFFLQTFLIVDGANIFVTHFTNWATTAVSLPITVGGYIAIVTTFLIGSWLIRHNGRGMMLFLLVISGLAVIGMACSENCYPLYFACLVVINIAFGALLVLGTAIVTNWFVSTRGRMLGFVTIGAPFSTAVCVPVLQRMLNAGIPFKGIFTVFGILIIVFGVLSFLLVPYIPEDVGLHADNAEKAIAAEAESNTGATAKWSLSKLVRCREAWCIMMAFGLMMLVSNCVMPLLIPSLLEVGINSNVALNLMTISAVVGIPLSYAWGWLDDKIGTKKSCYTLAVLFTLMSVGMTFAYTGNIVVVVLAVLGIAAVTGGSPNLNPSIIVNVFGASEYLNINRYLNIGQQILRLIALVMMSSIKDLTGSYTPGYVICIILSLVALCCFFGIRTRYSDAEN